MYDQSSMSAFDANQRARNYGAGGIGMMGIPMMGGMSTGGIMSGTFMYSGNSMGLQTRLESLMPEEINSIREINISCTGNEIKSVNIMCLICMFFWGTFLLFPMCFMFCGWWKKIVWPAHDVPIQAYQALCHLLSSSNVINLSLRVNDNRFGADKCQILVHFS